MPTELPKIAKTAERVTVLIEAAVRRMARYHKYAIGTDLRRDASKVYRCVDRAWHQAERRILRLRELSFAIDDLRLTLQLGKAQAAFHSFGEFEAISREVVSLGKQCGGWLKRLQGRGQNGPASPAGQRAQILSAHAASSEARA
jgi:hypothetical protein